MFILYSAWTSNVGSFQNEAIVGAGIALESNCGAHFIMSKHLCRGPDAIAALTCPFQKEELLFPVPLWTSSKYIWIDSSSSLQAGVRAAGGVGHFASVLG
jgi:hypothetical protein